jgi:hypothetical protein
LISLTVHFQPFVVSNEYYYILNIRFRQFCEKLAKFLKFDVILAAKDII